MRPASSTGSRSNTACRTARPVLDAFLASRPDLSAADRDMLRGWRDPVEGVFEIRSKDQTAIVLLNLLDDFEYRTYSNMGRPPSADSPRAGFSMCAWCLSARCQEPGWSRAI
jgi:hypothetical protein